jgi:outer membrane protein OmpA-like peptidoglycan-associated protein
MHRRFAVSLLAAVAVFSACQEDLTAEKAKWETIQKEWSAKVEKTKKGQAELTEKLKVAPVPAEETELVADKAALEKAEAGIGAAIADAEKAIGAAKANIDGLIAKGKKVPVEVALGNTKSSVDGVLSRAESLVNASTEQLEQLNRKVTTAGAEREAAKSRTAAWAGEVKKKGGLMSIDDLSFNADQLAIDKSRVALTSLLATLKTCPELRVEVVVTAASESAELSTKRADALKAYLTGKGIDAAVFAKVTGTSVKEADEKVAVTVTTPCK